MWSKLGRTASAWRAPLRTMLALLACLSVGVASLAAATHFHGGISPVSLLMERNAAAAASDAFSPAGRPLPAPIHDAPSSHGFDACFLCAIWLVVAGSLWAALVAGIERRRALRSRLRVVIRSRGYWRLRPGRAPPLASFCC